MPNHTKTPGQLWEQHNVKPKKQIIMFKDIKWGHQLVTLAVVIVGVVIANMLMKQKVEADGTIKSSLALGAKKEGEE